jgi:repressor LexA
MNMINLTPKQRQILLLIRDWRIRHGYSPTMQELGDALDVSKVTVFEHVEALIEKGALRRDRNRARSLELTDACQLPDEQHGTRLPLIGAIAAGSPIEAIEDAQYLDLDAIFASPGPAPSNVFVLKVRGDSMIDEQIADGDYVICRQTNQARSGQTVVALLPSGEATLKKFRKLRNGQYRLDPANEAYEPIIVDDLQIQGVAIGVIRRYA